MKNKISEIIEFLLSHPDFVSKEEKEEFLKSKGYDEKKIEQEFEKIKARLSDKLIIKDNLKMAARNKKGKGEIEINEEDIKKIIYLMEKKKNSYNK